MSTQPNVSFRVFAIVCGLWLVASLALPALGFFDSQFFMVMAFSIAMPIMMLATTISPTHEIAAHLMHWLAVAVWATIPVVSGFLAAKKFLIGQYKSSAVMALVFVAGVLLYFFGVNFGDSLRFRLHKAAYEAAISEASTNQCSDVDGKRWGVSIDGIGCRPLTVVFSWGGFLSGWHGVVYDAGDQIIKPPKERDAAWTKRNIGGLLSCSIADLKLGDHYYRAHGDYSTFDGCMP